MTNYAATESGLAFLWKTITEYQAPCFFVCAAILLLVFAAIFGGRRARAAFLYPLLLLAATAFNPYLFPWLFVRWPDLVEKYYWFLWAVPVTLLIGAGFTAIAYKFPQRWARALVILAAGSAIVLLGTPRISALESVETPDNVYKANAELITICDYIAGCSETESPLIAFEREDFAEEAIAYNPLIRLSGAEIPGDLESLNGEDFIVIGKNQEELETKLREKGYRAIAHTPDSYVFAVRK